VPLTHHGAQYEQVTAELGENVHARWGSYETESDEQVSKETESDKQV
jgi:hypothetical protein